MKVHMRTIVQLHKHDGVTGSEGSEVLQQPDQQDFLLTWRLFSGVDINVSFYSSVEVLNIKLRPSVVLCSAAKRLRSASLSEICSRAPPRLQPSLNAHLHRLMATSPSAPQPSSSMEESQQPEQPEQPISTQQDREAHDTPVTSQPVSAEQRALPPTTDAPDAKQAEEDRNMDHLTVMSDIMETSKYTDPAPAHRHIPHCDSPQQFLFSLLSNDSASC